MLPAPLVITARASIVAALICVAQATAAGRPDTVLPVVLQAPACAHDKLGTVSIQIGTRVTEATRDLLVPTVDYRGAFAKLALAAQAKGADAVVMRWHQATYFTRNTRRSHKPVHVQLRGAAIRVDAGAKPCEFALADPREFDERARSGKPVEIGSGEAYNNE